MRARGALLCVALLWAGCGSSCDGPPGPQYDVCDTPGAATLTSLEIGAARDDGNPVLPFHAIGDGERLRPVRGGQGAEMIMLHLQATGQVPECLAQRTTVTDIEQVRTISTFTQPMNTWPTGDGARRTNAIFLIGRYQGAVRVTVEAGGMKLDRILYTDLLGCRALAGCRSGCEGRSACITACNGGVSDFANVVLDELQACLAASCGSATDGGAPDGGASDGGAPPDMQCGACVKQQESCDNNVN